VTHIDRKAYFDVVRLSLFDGRMEQQQVDGQNAILDQWEKDWSKADLRWLAYELATTYHETGKAMWPIEEYGKGQGQSYGKQDPQTGQTYYGRGYVQLTWRDNYRKATVELGLKGKDDLEYHAERALDPSIAADVMFEGMTEGWFRPPNKLSTYFNATMNDPYEAREIINGDKHVVPSWSGGMSIGNLIARYHRRFLTALEHASVK
jgi:putative chitinase